MLALALPRDFVFECINRDLELLVLLLLIAVSLVPLQLRLARLRVPQHRPAFEQLVVSLPGWGVFVFVGVVFIAVHILAASAFAIIFKARRYGACVQPK